MKKKLLFLMNSMHYGGIETSLLNLLNVIDAEKYDVTLLFLRMEGELLNRIPPGISVCAIDLPEREKEWIYGDKKRKLLSYIRRGQWWKAPGFVVRNFKKRKKSFNRIKLAAHLQRVSDTIPCFPEEFDLAVDYFGNLSFTTYYLSEKIHARAKVSWLHCMYSRTFLAEEVRAFGSWYAKMDVIMACSGAVREDFLALFPTAPAVDVFYNITDKNRILKMAGMQGGFEDAFDGIRILTVGRISPPKGIDLAAKVCKRLLKNGYPVRWYIIGDGEPEIREQITANLKTKEEQENFVFLGFCENPYVYMKQCDIYVQPSGSEGYCVAILEAQVLGCAIVATDVGGAREQIINGENGYITAVDEAAICHAVQELILHPKIRERFQKNPAHPDGAGDQLTKLYAFLER